MGSSKIVNKKPVSLENKKMELRNIPHITANAMVIKNTARNGKSFIEITSLFINNMETENINITITLSNMEETAFPNKTAALFVGER
jgi:hypothetical protein